jgi:hypothetical protein
MLPMLCVEEWGLIGSSVCRVSRLGWLCDFVTVEFAVTLSSTGAKNLFKEMTPATSGVIARFPLLFPIRNLCELRGLCRRSYFGPRTCGWSINHFSSKCSGFLIRVSPSHPYNTGRAWLQRNHLYGSGSDSCKWLTRDGSQLMQAGRTHV